MFGVLALQGNYRQHIQALQKLGVKASLVRTAEELSKVSSLILPGGESTSIQKLMDSLDLFEVIRAFSRENKAILGTCAGAILLAKQSSLPQGGLALMDIKIKRNAYGRQGESFISHGRCPVIKGNDSKVDMVFIRAPRILSYDTGVEVLATHRSQPVWVQQNNMMATTFHPELSQDLKVYKCFLKFATKLMK